MPTFAPIALFVYRRPSHLAKTIAGLIANPEFASSPIYVFADGPKSDEDIREVNQTRKVARAALGDKATYIERGANVGLASSVIDGVTQLCATHGKVIVVEDDLVVRPTFLAYMNSALNRYENDYEVMQVSGHMFRVPHVAETGEALFLPFPTSWGWATWKRAWDSFDGLSTNWSAVLGDPQIRRAFDLDGHYPYSRMLTRQMRGQIDSWAIRWYYSIFCNQGLVLFPPTSLVENIGLDGSGTHQHAMGLKNPTRFESGQRIMLPNEIEVSRFRDDVFQAIAESTRKRPLDFASILLARLRREFRLAWIPGRLK